MESGCNLLFNMGVEKPLGTVTMIKGHADNFDLIWHTNNAFREVTQQAILINT